MNDHFLKETPISPLARETWERVGAREFRGNEQGQILIPGLAAFLGLMVLLAAMLGMGRHVLTQMRMDMAAEAATLSAARAEAQLLNDCAQHNIELQMFVPLSEEDYGIAEIAVKSPLELWMVYEKVGDLWRFKRLGMLGYPVVIGNTVAHMNGAVNVAHWPPVIDPYLTMRDMNVLFLNGYWPAGFKTFNNAYFVRTWKAGERVVQPPHKISWMASRNGISSSSTARLYLDEKRDALWNNGGFPSTDQNLADGFEILSFYPQFNARLIPTEAATKLLSLIPGGSSVF